MTNTEKKEWLKRYLEYKDDLRTIQIQYDELISIQTGVSAIKYSDMPKGSLNNNDLSSYMVDRERIKNKYYKVRYKMTISMIEIKNAINRLPDSKQRMLMTLKYIKGYTWEKICVEMDKSWKYIVYDLHSKALTNLEIPEKNLKK